MSINIRAYLDFVSTVLFIFWFMIIYNVETSAFPIYLCFDNIKLQ